MWHFICPCGTSIFYPMHSVYITNINQYFVDWLKGKNQRGDEKALTMIKNDFVITAMQTYK